MNGLNLSEVSDIRLGSNTINALYYGSNLLWPSKRDYSKEYLTIEALTDATVLFYKNGDDLSRTIQYSKDKTNWTSVDFNIFKNAPSVNITEGEKLYLKGNNSSYCIDYIHNKYCAINISEGVGNIYGNIMSLIYGDNFYGQTVLDTSYAFAGLFQAAYYNDIKDASNLILPATTLSEYCYIDLFSHCNRLTVAPKLPATKLARGCYGEMFNDCTSLTTAPELPATTLVDNCYRYMFDGCYNLNYIKCLATNNISSVYACHYWTDGVASTGTFIKSASATDWETGPSGIPSGWTVQDAS